LTPNNDVPPVNPVVCTLGCIEPRLAEDRLERLKRAGGGYQIGFAGAGAALLTEADGDACLRQFVYAYRVHKFGRGVIRVHFHCGYLAIFTAPGGELEKYDPTSLEDLYRIGDTGAKLVQEELLKVYGVDVPFDVEVIDIVRGANGEAAGVLVPRTALA
jgi:hypothetical protein